LKKILILISIFAVLSLAAEIPCDDVLRMADTSGVTIMPKTFDAIQDGGYATKRQAVTWPCPPPPTISYE
jgi:hypothetical protein